MENIRTLVEIKNGSPGLIELKFSKHWLFCINLIINFEKYTQPMNLKYFSLLGFLAFTLLSACTQESQNNAVKNLAKMSEAKFSDKEEATREINQLAIDYIATLNHDSLGIEVRYPLLSQKFIGKYQVLISHAINASKPV
ncbi:MAG: hypothetical protein DWQ02_19765, partial [Bacteroidetes bacterium]